MATFTTVPSAGETVSAATFSALVTELRPRQARRATDATPRPRDIVADDDDILTLSIAAGITYDFTAHIVYVAGTTADFKAGWSFPSDATLDYTAYNLDATTATVVAQTVSIGEASGSTKNFGGAGIVSPRFVSYWGQITVVTAGFLTFRWAQVNSTAEDTTVKAASRLVLRQAL